MLHEVHKWFTKLGIRPLPWWSNISPLSLSHAIWNIPGPTILLSISQNYRSTIKPGVINNMNHCLGSEILQKSQNFANLWTQIRQPYTLIQTNIYTPILISCGLPFCMITINHLAEAVLHIDVNVTTECILYLNAFYKVLRHIIDHYNVDINTRETLLYRK